MSWHKPRQIRLDKFDTYIARIGPYHFAFALDAAVSGGGKGEGEGVRQGCYRARDGQARATVRYVPDHAVRRWFVRAEDDRRGPTHRSARFPSFVLTPCKHCYSRKHPARWCH